MEQTRSRGVENDTPTNPVPTGSQFRSTVGQHSSKEKYISLSGQMEAIVYILLHLPCFLTKNATKTGKIFVALRPHLTDDQMLVELHAAHNTEIETSFIFASVTDDFIRFSR